MPKNVKLTDIRMILVDGKYPNTIFFKSSFERDFQQAVIINGRRKSDARAIELQKAYARKLGVTDAKK